MGDTFSLVETGGNLLGDSTFSALREALIACGAGPDISHALNELRQRHEQTNTPPNPPAPETRDPLKRTLSALYPNGDDKENNVTQASRKKTKCTYGPDPKKTVPRKALSPVPAEDLCSEASSSAACMQDRMETQMLGCESLNTSEARRLNAIADAQPECAETVSEIVFDHGLNKSSNQPFDHDKTIPSDPLAPGVFETGDWCQTTGVETLLPAIGDGRTWLPTNDIPFGRMFEMVDPEPTVAIGSEMQMTAVQLDLDAQAFSHLSQKGCITLEVQLCKIRPRGIYDQGLEGHTRFPSIDSGITAGESGRDILRHTFLIHSLSLKEEGRYYLWYSVEYPLPDRDQKHTVGLSSNSFHTSGCPEIPTFREVQFIINEAKKGNLHLSWEGKRPNFYPKGY